MSNTKGLDALAAAASNEDGADNNVKSWKYPPPESQLNQQPANGTSIQNQNLDPAAASLHAQHVHQAQALQLQQVQQVLAMRAQSVAQQQQAAHTAQVRLNQQQQLAALPTAQLVQQAQSLQQQKQVAGNNNYAFQQAQAVALAAAQVQLLQQQQQQGNTGVQPLAVNNGLAAVFNPVALVAGGQAGLATTTPGLQVQQQAYPLVAASPATLAMPPPPSVVPSLALCEQLTKKTTNKKSKPTSPPVEDIIMEWEDKKDAKRAANRLSAHLSRKRKKLFIDELKEENSELRRKELILRSIPDLIIVFDSSGCISFVSHSVTQFLDYTVEELVNTSFWERLTEESVRLIKSAFMDALAVKRSPKEDSTPLANGASIAVTLVNKQENLAVTLKGVVHFVGESPECVCSIRPLDGRDAKQNIEPASSAAKESSSSSSHAVASNRQERAATNGAPSHQISDIDSGSSI